MFLSNENGMSENFLSCIKGFKYHFEFTREHGISLEGPVTLTLTLGGLHCS